MKAVFMHIVRRVARKTGCERVEVKLEFDCGQREVTPFRGGAGYTNQERVGLEKML
jgi:hypothetical protein